MLGKKTGGRVKGTPNKSTATVKAALEEAFDRMGGADALLAWGKSEPAEFYKLWVKLLPQQHTVAGPNGGPIQVETKIDFSAIPSSELSEYESVLAKLQSRMAAPMGSPSSREVQAPTN